MIRRRGGPADPAATLDSSPQNRRLLYIFSYIATLIGLQILHLALDDVPMLVGMTAGVTAGFVYSYYLAPRHRTLTTYGVSLVALFLSIYYFMQMLGNYEMLANYLGILLGALTVLLAFKAFAPSDHRFILLVCVVFLLYSSAASYDIKFLLLLPIFLMFSGLVLYIANQFDITMRVEGSRGGVPVISHLLGRGFLGILARAVGGIILLSIIAYIVTPHSNSSTHSLALKPASAVQAPSRNDGEETPEQERNRNRGGADDNVARVGLGDEFDLSQPSELESEPRPVLKVRGRRNGYMRAKVYSVYTGSGWNEFKSVNSRSQLGENEEKIVDPGFKHTAQAGSVTSLSGPFYRYHIDVFDFPDPAFLSNRQDWNIHLAPNNISSTNLEKLNYDIIIQEVTFLEEGPPIFLSMYQPFRIENVSKLPGRHGGGSPIVFDRNGIVETNGKDIVHPRNFSYVVHSIEPQAGPGSLAAIFTKGPEPLVDLYTQLPLSPRMGEEALADLGIEPEQYRPISERMQNHAMKFARAADGSKASPWEIVSNIYDYLTDPSAFTYTREYDPLDPKMEITEAFCLGTREGYCRYFASSMAVMCRLNGIPSRVVTGYKPGSFSWVENANVYKASDAHAWVEVYFDGYGWLPFDPSPASQDITQQDAGRWLASVTDFLQELFVIDPASTQQMLIESLKEIWEFMLRNRSYTFSLIGLLLLLGLLWYLKGRIRLKQRPAVFHPENAVVAAYYSAQEELRRLGLKRERGSTARQFILSAQEAYPALGEYLEPLLPVYERAAFAPAQVTSEDAGAAGALIDRLREFVREEIRRRKQK